MLTDDPSPQRSARAARNYAQLPRFQRVKVSLLGRYMLADRREFPCQVLEMSPGDALYFHPNLLHRSDQNLSDKPRWSMICCYNAARNDPYKDAHHPRYTPLSKVPDSAILEAGRRATAATLEFLDPDKDQTTGATKASVGTE